MSLISVIKNCVAILEVYYYYFDIKLERKLLDQKVQALKDHDICY